MLLSRVQGQTGSRLAVPPTPRVFDRIRTLIIGEAGGKLAEDRDAFFDSAEAAHHRRC